MKRYIYILITGVLLLSSCEKFKILVTPFPSSIILQSIDISEADGISIMNVPKESAQTKALTKAEEETLKRLCIVAKEGTKIAEFDMKIDGTTDNPIWEKIYPTLTYVPGFIVDFSSNFILLADVNPVYDQDLLTSDEIRRYGQDLSNSLKTASGYYLLRKADGRLYNCPIDDYPYGAFDSQLCSISETSDKKTIVFVTCIYQIGNCAMIIKDLGDKLESMNTNGQVIAEDYSFSYLADDNHYIVFQNNVKTGAWSFDMKLSPAFVDFGEKMKALCDDRSYTATSDYFFIPNGDTPYIVCNRNASDMCVDHKKIVDGEIVEDRESLFIGKIVSKNGKIEYEKLAYLNEEVYLPYNRSVVGDKLILTFNGKIISIDTATDDVSIIPYPQGFPQDMDNYINGKCHKLSSDFKQITCYDLNKFQSSTINVNWEGKDDLISGTVLDGAGFFTVNGLSRSAATLSYLISKDTGEVTLLGTQTYSAPAVTSYLPLN